MDSKKRCECFFGSRRGFRVDFFSPFLPVPNNHAKPTPPRIPKSTPISEDDFLGGFVGCSVLVFVAAFGCSIFYADKPRLVSKPFLF